MRSCAFLAGVLLAAAVATVASAEHDLCAAYGNDCMRCAQHAECGFCGDGEYAPDESIEAGAHVGGWIFRQRGLEVGEDGEDIETSLAASAAHRKSITSHLAASRSAAAAALADASLLVQQLSPAQLKQKQTVPAAAFIEVGEGHANAARAGMPIDHLPHPDAAAASLSSVSATAHDISIGAGAGHREGQAPKAAGKTPAAHHRPLLGCYNRTQMASRMNAYAEQLKRAAAEATTTAHGDKGFSLPRFTHAHGPMCIDFRTDACDCAGADTQLPRCAAVVQEVRTPVVLIVSALALALSLVATVVGVQLHYGRCWKRHEMGGEEAAAKGTMLATVHSHAHNAGEPTVKPSPKVVQAVAAGGAAGNAVAQAAGDDTR